MIKLKDILLEAGGQTAGVLEIDKISIQDARKYITKLGHNPDEVFDNFNRNFKFAQKMAGMGRTQRKDMPVLEKWEVRELQVRLKLGYFDVTKPFSSETDPGNPFPEGLSGKEASRFMSNGIRDKKKGDDRIDVKLKRVQIGKLKPIQKQIYFDKSVNNTLQFGVESSKDFLQNSILVASSDLFIIDGHHRYLSGLLIDPKLPVKVLLIDMPLKDLLPFTLAYSDAVGNKRNA